MKILWKNEEDRMRIVEKEGVVFLSHPALDSTGIVGNGFSTRLGGVSKHPYGSMNLSFTRGDDENAVYENYRRMAAALGVAINDIVTSAQTHTTNVIRVSKENGGIQSTPRFSDVDGLVTNEKGVVLSTSYADCVPLYFVDPVHKAIGLSHSGWAGTVHRMGNATLKKMHACFGTDAEEVIAVIGPSICQDCYEVSDDVISQFRDEFDACWHDKLFYAKENGKYQLNLQEANRIIMMEAGVKKEQIHMSGICTCCNPDFLHSNRAVKGGKRGNLNAFLWLK